MNITDERAETVCKIGQGDKTCGYCMVGGSGFECAKRTSLEHIIQKRLAAGTMIAKSDNCQGPAQVILDENKVNANGN